MGYNKENTNKKEVKPFIAPGSNVKATAKDIEQRKKKIAKAKEIGQSITKVDSNDEYENPYRVMAICYISQGKDVPEKLKDQIKKFDKQHEKNISNNTKKQVLTK